MSYADFSNVSFGPVIRNFSAQPVSGDMPLMVNFQTDIIEGSVPLSDIHIQFGDGDRASGNQSYTHIYNQAGKYSAYIQVRDESGNIAFQEKQIHVLDPTYYNVGLTIQPDKSGFIYGDLDCSDNCQSSVRESQTIQLTQQSENGYTFSHWTGCDQTNQGSCVVTTNHEKNISAHFVCLTPEIPEIETLSGQVIQSSHQFCCCFITLNDI
jgi:PKD repeat protein